MSPVPHDVGTPAWQADALFASALQRCDEPSAGQVRRAVATAVRAFGYAGCAGKVAQEFGDHPEVAAARMRWAIAQRGYITHGEGRVLRFLPTRLSTREIAAELRLSANTVKTHRRHLYAKLGAHSRAQAVEQARILGLLATAPLGPVAAS